MRTQEFTKPVDLPKVLAKFLPIAVKVLKLKGLPKIELEGRLESNDGQATFGRFVNDNQTIYLAIADRHPVDILRTLAHELTHFKQWTEQRLNAHSGETGSDEENEANAMSGVIMRIFNKTYPETMRLEPLVLRK